MNLWHVISILIISESINFHIPCTKTFVHKCLYLYSIYNKNPLKITHEIMWQYWKHACVESSNADNFLKDRYLATC